MKTLCRIRHATNGWYQCVLPSMQKARNHVFTACAWCSLMWYATVSEQVNRTTRIGLHGCWWRGLPRALSWYRNTVSTEFHTNEQWWQLVLNGAYVSWRLLDRKCFVEWCKTLNVLCDSAGEHFLYQQRVMFFTDCRCCRDTQMQNEKVWR